MSGIIVPQQHLRQPTGRVYLDRDNPLAVGFVFAETPAARSGAFFPVGAVGDVVSSGLRGFGLDGSSYLRNSISPVRNYPLTFLCVFERALGTLGALISIGAGTQRQLMYYLADGRLKCFSGAGGSSAENGTYLIDDGPLHWAAMRVHSASSRDLWYNGALIDSNTTTITTTDMPTAAIGTYWNNDGPALTMQGKIYLAAAWSRAISDAELREMYRNPWQLFRADPIRIYSLPSGPISISWSSLTASNITQTGARLTLGGIVR